MHNHNLHFISVPFLFCCLLSVFIAVHGLQKEAKANANANHTQAEQTNETKPEPWEEAELEPWEEDLDSEQPGLADPLKPVNKVIFVFNDKLYLYGLKPVSQVYVKTVPQPMRTGIDNFFYNLRFPIRFVNSLLQGKLKKAGQETTSFALNSVLGFAGFLKPSQEVSWLSPEPSKEDTGQTLGVWGFGPGFYIVWPIIGPSSLRGTAGKVGDFFLDPVTYIERPLALAIGVDAAEKINALSLRLGEYEDLKEAAFDPYIAFREGYYQYRLKLIKE